jgi:hypothetical protein
VNILNAVVTKRFDVKHDCGDDEGYESNQMGPEKHENIYSSGSLDLASLTNKFVLKIKLLLFCVYKICESQKFISSIFDEKF